MPTGMVLTHRGLSKARDTFGDAAAGYAVGGMIPGGAFKRAQRACGCIADDIPEQGDSGIATHKLHFRLRRSWLLKAPPNSIARTDYYEATAERGAPRRGRCRS